MHYFDENLFSLYKFLHWFAYVDDTFILVPSNTDFPSLMSWVNLIDHCIQFTFEVENNNSLLFLDVLVSKHTYYLSTLIGSQQLSSENSPHALSIYPPQQKMAAFCTGLWCFTDICSDVSNFSNELNYLKSLSLSQGYNPSIIDKALKKPKCSVYYFDPFLYPIILPSISFKIFKILSHFCFKVSFKPVNKTKFSSPKDLISAKN